MSQKRSAGKSNKRGRGRGVIRKPINTWFGKK